MSTSLWLAIGVFAVFTVAAAAMHHFGKVDPKHRWKGPAMFVLGLAMSVFAYFADFGLRRETLFEVISEGSRGAVVGEPAPVHSYPFDVLHPGVEHTLNVYPEIPAPTIWLAEGEIEVLVRVRDAAGNVLVEGRNVHQPMAWERLWRHHSYPFTPSATGAHTLEIVPLTAGTPAVHARIVDPVGLPEGSEDRRVPGH